MSKPFDAAIEALEKRAIVDEEQYPNDSSDIRAAIRVLEAAGKVDERDLGRVFMGFVSAGMRELLEAIKSSNSVPPDKEDR